MQWIPSLPGWLRVVFVLLGVSTIVNGLGHLSEMTAPSLAIGLAWAAVGWKGGFPVIPTEPGASIARTGHRSEALRLLRRRRIVGIVVPLLWLPFALLTLPLVAQHLIPTVLFVSAVTFFLPALTWSLSACPRCAKHFFISKYMIVWGFASRCRNCGLPIR